LSKFELVVVLVFLWCFSGVPRGSSWFLGVPWGSLGFLGFSWFFFGFLAVPWGYFGFCEVPWGKEWPGKTIYFNFDSIFGDFFLKFFEEEVSDYLS
jgi:hypothetical protein